MWDRFGKEINAADKIHHVGHKIGNIITVSVPFDIAHAITKWVS
ncbi:hypothetical protein [Xenorhabdus hominickii]|uniref:3-ketoacyl-CoA thiolase n=1 Tax=Xenorhabdus hominickii TaxID=351679 RepID=A0A2G0Q4B7_XENHO|nr:hypothetical protein [Xenorhabdus hominickii]PHM54055.1 3-ketoacyl-CoA thiolase [Xenorhabdus hominickii]